MKISQLKTGLIKDLNRATKGHVSQMAILNALPESLDVSSICLESVHLNKASYVENMDTLHLLRQHCGNYKLEWYGAVRKGTLALKYRFDGFDLFMNCNDPENALNIVSNGKCQLKETEEIIEAVAESVEKRVRVVCPIA